jgi:hypothetical protein
MLGGGGKRYTNYLPAGILVICDKETHIAKWVAICGNTIVTTSWKAEGKIIPFQSEEDYESACKDMLMKLDLIQNKLDQVLSLLSKQHELKPTLSETSTSSSSTTTSVTEGSWTAAKTGAIFAGTGIGFVAGGFGFPTTETITHPGPGAQTGSGTWIYAPARIETQKSFNVLGGISGAVLGGVLTYVMIK